MSGRSGVCARERSSMSIRIAASGVSHWHSLYDAAYLRRLARMPDVQLVGLHDPNPQIAAQRSAAVGNPPIFSAQVTGAQLSWRALEQCVEDYATVLLRSESGVLGTLEVGNTFPGDVTDGAWKIAGRDAILVLKDNVLRVITAQGTETLSATTPEPPYMLILRQTLEHWQRGAPPPVSVHDCYRAVQLIDQAYEIAGQ